MKNFLTVLALFACTLFIASCAKEQLAPSPQELATGQDEFLSEDALVKIWGAGEEIGTRNAQPLTVYTLGNEAGGNEVIAFRIHDDGSLSEFGRYATGGAGTDTGLGNQGALAIAKNALLLYAVNPGSDNISVFYILPDGSLQLKDTISSGGEMPVSITERNGLIYVLNAGGGGSISGFAYNHQAELVHISNSTKPLSSANAGPAQISFSPNGKALVVTEKMTNTITSYRMLLNRPYQMHTFPSAGVTPFGFDFGNNNNFFVSEASGGMPGASTVSSYHVDNNGVVTLVDGPSALSSTAACWVVLSNNKKYMYTTNTGSNDISTVSLSGFGKVTGVDDDTAPAMNAPIDAAMDKNSDYMYVLASGTDAIISYEVNNDGSLTQIDMDANGLPGFMTGIVVK